MVLLLIIVLYHQIYMLRRMYLDTAYFNEIEKLLLKLL